MKNRLILILLLFIITLFLGLGILRWLHYDSDIDTAVEIAAKPEQVWFVLSNVKSIPEWNTSVRSVSGNWRQGGPIELRLVWPGGDTAHYFGTILGVKQNYELRWETSTLTTRFLSFKHKIILTTCGHSCTKVRNEIEIHGLIAGRITLSVAAAINKVLNSMNNNLKQRVEQG